MECLKDEITSIHMTLFRRKRKMRILKSRRSDLTLAIGGEERKFEYCVSTQNAISFMILMAQFFGLMPLYDIVGKDSESVVRFELKSFRFFYSVYNLIGAFVSAVFCFVRFGMVGLMIDKTATMAFYICNFFGILRFLQIAKHWNFIMEEWGAVERSMGNYSSQIKLKKRFVIMSAAFMNLALLEHLLFVVNGINTTVNCQYGNDTQLEIYFEFTFPHVFRTVDFSVWKAVLVEMANILTTFSWNFTDLFIMLLSTSLALRFYQINKRLETDHGTQEKFWKEIRLDYNKLTGLCKTVDESISPLVTISFINNLFFICVQLYNSLKPRHGFIEALYFFYSFGFLLARTIAVSLYAAWINDESRKPLEYLHAVPTEYYNIEVSRLTQQIYTHPVGLTGSNFFLVTRSFLLQVAGTIVTFELMLLQFGPILQADQNAQDVEDICLGS